MISADMYGAIEVLGEIPPKIPVRQLATKVGSIFDNPEFQMSQLSVFEEVALGLQNLGVEKSIIEKNISESLKLVGLEGFEDRSPFEISGGQQQRLAMASALAMKPEILILDEPTSGLDPVGAKQIKDLIATLASRGKTVLLCYHLLSDVEDLCDRIAIMYGGKVRSEGTCEGLLQEEHASLLETSEIPETALAEVREVLGRHSVTISSIKRPRRRLESLFLEIVEKALAAGLKTSGAGNSGSVASFLANPTNEEQLPVESEATNNVDGVDTKLLDSLVDR